MVVPDAVILVAASAVSEVNAFDGVFPAMFLLVECNSLLSLRNLFKKICDKSFGPIQISEQLEIVPIGASNVGDMKSKIDS